MKHKRKRRSASPLSAPFTGEWMECLLCGKRERSSRHTGSRWTVIQRQRRHYICPDHIPADPAQFLTAYLTFQAAAVQKEAQHGR